MINYYDASFLGEYRYYYACNRHRICFIDGSGYVGYVINFEMFVMFAAIYDSSIFIIFTT